MNPHTARKSAALAVLAGLLSLSPLVSVAAPTQDITTLADFQAWAEAKALCQDSPFTIPESDPALIAQLRRLPLKVVDQVSRDDESGLYEGTLTLQTPVTVFGFTLKEIMVYMDSGREFNLVLVAEPQDLVALLHRHRLTRYPSDTVSEDYRHLYYTSKPTPQAPWGEDSQGIIRSTNRPHQTSIGCWQIDG